MLAELSRRDLVPAIWLPNPGVRGDRERARWRLHLVRHRTALKNRIHATLLAFDHPCPVNDLFGAGGRRLLDGLGLPEPWAGDVVAALRVIDVLGAEIDDCEAALRREGATHAYVPTLMTAPGIGWLLGYTIAAELGDITRFPTPKKLVGYTGLCPAVDQWTVPCGRSVRRPRLAPLIGQERPEVPALGTDRGGHPRRPAPGLRRPLPAHQDPAGPPARPLGRPRGHRPQPRAPIPP